MKTGTVRSPLCSLLSEDLEETPGHRRSRKDEKHCGQTNLYWCLSSPSKCCGRCEGG